MVSAMVKTKTFLSVFLIAVMISGLAFIGDLQFIKAQNGSQTQQQTTASYSDNFSTDSGLWQYLGSAYRDPTNQDIMLNPSGFDEAGVAFFNYPVSGSFTANFSYLVGGGNWPGDGFTMFFYKQQYSTLDNGGSLAFSSPNEIVPGYGIEFDSWQNPAGDFQYAYSGQPVNPAQGDPPVPYIGLIEDYAGNHLAYTGVDPRVDDDTWHQVSVQVQGSSVSVYVDQGLVLHWTGSLNRTYSGFGFSGATGDATDWHIIANFSITAQNLKTPTLTTSCISSVSQSSLNVNINGDLTYDGTGISDAPILLPYSVTGGESWQDLTLVNTGLDGSYSALWFPSVTGNYLLQAVYQGSENYLGASNIVSFAMTPGVEQSVFSVTSNSTLSELSFDSTSQELSFIVSGEPGTRGYVDVAIPKSLIADISNVKVYLDNNPIAYTVQSQSDCWLLYFTYHHSTHNVDVDLGSPTTSTGTAAASTPTSSSSQTSPVQQLTTPPMSLIAAEMAIAIMAVAIAAFLLGKRTERNRTHSADYQI